jgi:hypothetical protein
MRDFTPVQDVFRLPAMRGRRHIADRPQRPFRRLSPVEGQSNQCPILSGGSDVAFRRQPCQELSDLIRSERRWMLHRMEADEVPNPVPVALLRAPAVAASSNGRPNLIAQPGLPGGIIHDVPPLMWFGHTASLLSAQNDARKRIHTRPVRGLISH